MDSLKRAIIYFDPDIHRALRLKAATADRSISEIVNEAVQLALAEDAIDLAAIEECRHQRTVNFDGFVKRLKRRGWL
jgi:hypothetical protein